MKKVIFLIAGLAISVACLWYVLSRVENLGELGGIARSLKWQWVAACFAVFYAGFYLRATRWAIFFPRESQVTGRKIFGPMMTGYALNSLFPGRVGEAARPLLVARRENVNVPASLSSVVAERLVDMAVILALLAFVLATIDFSGFSKAYGDFTLNEAFMQSMARKTTYLVAALTIIVVLLMTAAFRGLIERIINRLPLLPEAVKQFFIKLMHSFAHTMAVLKGPKDALAVLFLSILVWGSGAWCIQLLAPAFSMEMTLLQAAAIMVVMCVAISLPATPGYWGLFEFGFVAGCALMKVEGSAAQIAAMALLLHLIQYVPIVVFGLIWASMTGTSLLETARKASSAEPAPSACAE